MYLSKSYCLEEQYPLESVLTNRPSLKNLFKKNTQLNIQLTYVAIRVTTYYSINL